MRYMTMAAAAAFALAALPAMAQTTTSNPNAVTAPPAAPGMQTDLHFVPSSDGGITGSWESPDTPGVYIDNSPGTRRPHHPSEGGNNGSS